MDEDIMKMDLYEIIGSSITADESELKKAYRKKALACHPDKNPDNPKAAELFLQLTRALEILTDATARAAYDKVVNRKIQIEVEKKASSAKRRKFIDDLEAREEAFKNSQTASYNAAKSDEEKLKAEIDRLKKEGSRLVEEENERLRQQILKELSSKIIQSNNMYGMNGCRVKIKWKAAADDDTNGGYNYENLHRFLSKHGDISILVVSAAKKGRALVEYENHDAALSAVKYECGLITNQIKLQGMWQDPKSVQASSKYSTLFTGGSLFSSAEGTSNAGRSQAPQGLGTMFTGGSLFPSAGGVSNARRQQVPQGLSCSSVPDIFNTPPQNDFVDFENTVLNNLKREEERKKLIEQMKAEDEGT